MPKQYKSGYIDERTFWDQLGIPYDNPSSKGKVFFKKRSNVYR